MAFSLSLEGKIALITGATKGIGWASAQALAQNGATVLVNGRNAEQCEERARSLRDSCQTPAAALPYDASQPAAIQNAFRKIFADHKRLDILVNNAGVMKSGLLGMIKDEEIHETLNINTVGVVHHIQEAARLMRRNKSGSIVNVSSIVGRFGTEGQIVYAASKAAVLAMTQSAARELAPSGIRVNAVAPGMIKTDLLNDIPEDKRNARLASIRLGRFGEPDEVAATILFLAGGMSSYITGQVFGVDGGMVV